MPAPALASALADIDRVFEGFAAPNEEGCGYCQVPEKTAYLRTPYVDVPVHVVQYCLFKAVDHVTDHAASMRRLLPQAARAMADGTLGAIACLPHGWSRRDLNTWPAEQSDAIRAFLIAWWQDALTTPEPPYGVRDVFDTCATIARTVTPFLVGWVGGPVADAPLVHCADDWFDLISDHAPFPWFRPCDSEDAAARAELRAWLAGPGAARLRALGERGLATRVGLLGLPEEECWAHPYGNDAPTDAD
ncbi:hypothetical protein [Streptomyces sp. NPDC050263]|uniref:hypothetical protein n=1 Tax=Streptomyces sp. NPDC050263 TaxID=3155037 RepID=UPI00341AB705